MNNPVGKNQYPECGGCTYLRTVMYKFTNATLIVPATDERLRTALFEYARLNITSNKTIKQYLMRDYGIDMRLVFWLVLCLKAY